MFMKIDTRNANYIVISVPSETSATSLPQLINMFEHNAVFVQQSWSAPHTVVEPKIEIMLGDTLLTDNGEHSMFVTKSDCVLDEQFVIYDPQVRADYVKALDKKEKENTKLRAEVNYLNNELNSLKEQLAALQDNQDNQDN